MARKKRKARADGMSLRDIERLLEERQSELQDLEARREELAAELDGIDAEIGALEGRDGVRRGRPKKGTRKRAGKKRKAGRKKIRGKKARGKKKGKGRGGRRRGGQKVEDVIEKVMRAGGGTMSLADITQAVVNAGYKTTSQRFSVIINQRLAKMPNVKRVERGIYRLK